MNDRITIRTTWTDKLGLTLLLAMNIRSKKKADQAKYAYDEDK